MKNWSLLGLRLVIAAIFLLHGIPKLLNLAGTMNFFSGLGFPAFLGPVVGVLEVLGALAILLGFWHKGATYVLALIIVVAILAVQIPGALERGISAGLERDVLILASILVLMTYGSGKLAVQ
ncbi:MAG: DoxX family protein [Nanoarchaeota archaeon]|nr:DoxX family protein [Nanoarchaeota archaeon]